MKVRPAVRRTIGLACLAVLSVIGLACTPSAPDGVVVYVALDREFSEPILRDFERVSGIEVSPKYDVESTKTVGLVNELLRQRRHPRCDVFWNNELLHTLRLEREGLLDVYLSPAAADYPDDVRAADGAWHGFAARARVLLVNTELVSDADRPDSVDDLVDPRWKDRTGLAKPLFGTTATHAAVLFAQRGPEAAQDFFRRIKANARIMSGNKQVATAVGRGQLAWGLTDTDDALVEIAQGRPVAIVFPDQGEDAPGCLFIPNSLSILRGAPHPEAARKLVDYLLSEEVEVRLARGESGQFPLNPRVTVRPDFVGDEAPRRMQVDFRAAAAEWEEASAWLRDEFTNP